MITTTIMNYMSQAIIFVAGIIMYVFIAGKLLPTIFLRPSRKGLRATDRGLKRYVYEDGRAAVYKPTEQNNQYIEQYILSVNGIEKFIKCKIHKEIFSLEYDVIAFDSRDKVLDVISVKDPIREKEVTAAVSLPLDTSYVTVVARRVNGVRVTRKDTVGYSYLGILAYSLLCSALTVGVVMGIKALIFPFIDPFIHYTQRVGNNGDAATVIISAIVGMVCALLVVLMHCSGSIKVKNDSFVIALTKKIFTKMRGVRHGKESTANFKRLLSIFSSK